MRIIGIGVATALAGIVWAAKLEARPVESLTVKVPFAFQASNRVLPAGTYQMEMLTKAQPGIDEVEVIALRGTETRSYTAMVTRLGRSEALAPVMSFSQDGETPVLAEVRANGRSFAVTAAETDYADNQPEPRFDLPSEPMPLPVSAALGQE
jgi:hypothetical protein